MKKMFCIFMCFIAVLSFVSCKQSEKTDENTTEPENQEEIIENGDEGETVKSRLILPYNEKDSLSPYEAKGQINIKLSTLIFDSLYSLDEKFMPTGVIAESEENDKLNLTVKLKSGVVFSDGSNLTASNVVNSFYSAKSSDTYSGLLENFSSATAVDNLTVRFTLLSEDRFAVNCLTFPIVENSGDTFIGSGRYYLSSGELKYNKNHVSGSKPKIKTISLCNIDDTSLLYQKMQVGIISTAYNDLSDCKNERLTAKAYNVSLNNLVFLGIDNTNALLKDSNLRKAISMAINKIAIVQKDFQGFARETEAPFNTDWGEIGFEMKPGYNQSAAVQLLDDNGYKYPDSTARYRGNEKGKSLSFTLVVNKKNAFRLSAAESIKQSLSEIGIEIKIKSLSDKDYKEAIKSGKFDLYLGEIKLPENMNLSAFFSESGSAGVKIDKKLSCISAYKKMLGGSGDIEKFVSQFQEDVPFIPLCFRDGVFIVSNALKENVNATQTDLYLNISKWQFK